MPNHKKCRIWGTFFADELVMYRRNKWRVIATQRKNVPRGRMPIEPTNEIIKKMAGVIVVPIDDVDRLVRQPKIDQ